MNTPGFTAEASSYKTRNQYKTSLTVSNIAAGVSLAQNAGLGPVSDATVTGFLGRCRLHRTCHVIPNPANPEQPFWYCTVDGVVCSPWA
jgi:hypothetical protein